MLKLFSGLYLDNAYFSFFHILVFWEYWFLTKSRITLMPVLGGVRIVALSISSHEQTNKTESVVF